FSWDPLNAYSAILEEDDDDADEEERLAYEDQINRLRVADQGLVALLTSSRYLSAVRQVVTQNMTKEEYIHYSECRQASFTYKKLKRFREWCEMGKVRAAGLICKYCDTKGSSDIIDSLGFLCHETVGTITEQALKIKKLEDEYGTRFEASQEVGLFCKSGGERTPLLPRHIHEAYR
ncbi:Transcription initiation protein spt3, partial [Kappamyces sp. JEL0680]